MTQYTVSDKGYDHSDNKRKPTATTSHATRFEQQQGIFYMLQSTDKILHTMVFIIPILEPWME